jgi:hypothetical protein
MSFTYEPNCIPTAPEETEEWKEYWNEEDQEDSAAVHLQRLRLAMEATEMLAEMLVYLDYCPVTEDITKANKPCKPENRNCKECMLMDVSRKQSRLPDSRFDKATADS